MLSDPLRHIHAVCVVADIKYSFLLHALCFYYNLSCVIIIGFTISTMISTDIIFCHVLVPLTLFYEVWDDFTVAT